MVFLPSFHKWENTTELFGMKMYYIKNQKKNLEAILTLNEWQKEKKLKRMLIPVFFFFFPTNEKTEVSRSEATFLRSWEVNSTSQVQQWNPNLYGTICKTEEVLWCELNQPGLNTQTQTFMVPSVRRSGHQEVLRCELNQPGPNTQSQMVMAPSVRWSMHQEVLS